MTFNRNVIPFSIGVVQELALWFIFHIIASRKIVYLELSNLSAILSGRRALYQKFTIYLGQIWWWYLVRKVQRSNEMDEVWETCPSFSNGDLYFFSRKKKPCVWMALGKRIGKNKGLDGLGHPCDTICLDISYLFGAHDEELVNYYLRFCYRDCSTFVFCYAYNESSTMWMTIWRCLTIYLLNQKIWTLCVSTCSELNAQPEYSFKHEGYYFSRGLS